MLTMYSCLLLLLVPGVFQKAKPFEKRETVLCVWLSSEWFPLKEVSVGSSAGKGESPNTEVKDRGVLVGDRSYSEKLGKARLSLRKLGFLFRKGCKRYFFFRKKGKNT